MYNVLLLQGISNKTFFNWKVKTLYHNTVYLYVTSKQLTCKNLKSFLQDIPQSLFASSKTLECLGHWDEINF